MTQLSLLDRKWVQIHEGAVLEHMRGKPDWTADDVRSAIPDGPANRNWWGCLLASLKGLGLIERIGYRPSTRPEANGRVVAVWRVK